MSERTYRILPHVITTFFFRFNRYSYNDNVEAEMFLPLYIIKTAQCHHTMVLKPNGCQVLTVFIIGVLE